MQTLETCIRFWKDTLFHNQFLMSPSIMEFVKSTIKHLEAFETYQGQLPSEVGKPEIGE